MKVAIITGSAGLIGSESVHFFSNYFDKIIGIDNNMRQYFFGESASTLWNQRFLEDEISNYVHATIDIRNQDELGKLFAEYNSAIKLVIHTAAQPSHDWAANEPITDFSINANGTLCLLEMTRKFCPDATFIFTSTNKVYGDTPNNLPFVEKDRRWEISEDHPYFEEGIDENMSIDQSKHSLFGVSKVSADVMVQEYGRYFGMYTGVFRGGCLTGPNHSGAQLHGFLSYLMKCAITGDPYTIFGYKGKQVRDNIHSYDLVNMFSYFYQNPRQGEVYNAGGGRYSNCSVLEAIRICEEITNKEFNYTLSDQNRSGDHIWYISDLTKFKNHYPGWTWEYNLMDTMIEMYESMKNRFKRA